MKKLSKFLLIFVSLFAFSNIYALKLEPEDIEQISQDEGKYYNDAYVFGSHVYLNSLTLARLVSAANTLDGKTEAILYYKDGSNKWYNAVTNKEFDETEKKNIHFDITRITDERPLTEDRITSYEEGFVKTERNPNSNGLELSEIFLLGIEPPSFIPLQFKGAKLTSTTVDVGTKTPEYSFNESALALTATAKLECTTPGDINSCKENKDNVITLSENAPLIKYHNGTSFNKHAWYALLIDLNKEINEDNIDNYTLDLYNVYDEGRVEYKLEAIDPETFGGNKTSVVLWLRGDIESLENAYMLFLEYNDTKDIISAEQIKFNFDKVTTLFTEKNNENLNIVNIKNGTNSDVKVAKFTNDNENYKYTFYVDTVTEKKINLDELTRFTFDAVEVLPTGSTATPNSVSLVAQYFDVVPQAGFDFYRWEIYKEFDFKDIMVETAAAEASDAVKWNQSAVNIETVGGKKITKKQDTDNNTYYEVQVSKSKVMKDITLLETIDESNDLYLYSKDYTLLLDLDVNLDMVKEIVYGDTPADDTLENIDTVCVSDKCYLRLTLDGNWDLSRDVTIDEEGRPTISKVYSFDYANLTSRGNDTLRIKFVLVDKVSRFTPTTTLPAVTDGMPDSYYKNNTESLNLVSYGLNADTALTVVNSSPVVDFYPGILDNVVLKELDYLLKSDVLYDYDEGETYFEDLNLKNVLDGYQKLSINFVQANRELQVYKRSELGEEKEWYGLVLDFGVAPFVEVAEAGDGILTYTDGSVTKYYKRVITADNYTIDLNDWLDISNYVSDPKENDTRFIIWRDADNDNLLDKDFMLWEAVRLLSNNTIVFTNQENGTDAMVIFMASTVELIEDRIDGEVTINNSLEDYVRIYLYEILNDLEDNNEEDDFLYNLVATNLDSLVNYITLINGNDKAEVEQAKKDLVTFIEKKVFDYVVLPGFDPEGLAYSLLESKFDVLLDNVRVYFNSKSTAKEKEDAKKAVIEVFEIVDIVDYTGKTYEDYSTLIALIDAENVNELATELGIGELEADSFIGFINGLKDNLESNELVVIFHGLEALYDQLFDMVLEIGNTVDNAMIGLVNYEKNDDNNDNIPYNFIVAKGLYEFDFTVDGTERWRYVKECELDTCVWKKAKYLTLNSVTVTSPDEFVDKVSGSVTNEAANYNQKGVSAKISESNPKLIEVTFDRALTPGDDIYYLDLDLDIEADLVDILDAYWDNYSQPDFDVVEVDGKKLIRITLYASDTEEGNGYRIKFANYDNIDLMLNVRINSTSDEENTLELTTAKKAAITSDKLLAKAGEDTYKAMFNNNQGLVAAESSSVSNQIDITSDKPLTDYAVSSAASGTDTRKWVGVIVDLGINPADIEVEDEVAIMDPTKIVTGSSYGDFGASTAEGSTEFVLWLDADALPLDVTFLNHNENNKYNALTVTFTYTETLDAFNLVSNVNMAKYTEIGDAINAAHKNNQALITLETTNTSATGTANVLVKFDSTKGTLYSYYNGTEDKKWFAVLVDFGVEPFKVIDNDLIEDADNGYTRIISSLDKAYSVSDFTDAVKHGATETSGKHTAFVVWLNYEEVSQSGGKSVTFKNEYNGLTKTVVFATEFDA